MTKEDLDELKKRYVEFQERYSLPTFDELNQDFQIEKIAEIETDFLLREVRKMIVEKLFNYLRFIESLLNPVNVPMFVYSIVKTLGVQEKEEITEMYKKLAKREVELIALDLDSTDEKEVEFIKDSLVLWEGIKKDILKIAGVIDKNWDSETETNNKDYFG